MPSECVCILRRRRDALRGAAERDIEVFSDLAISRYRPRTIDDDRNVGDLRIAGEGLTGHAPMCSKNAPPSGVASTANWLDCRWTCTLDPQFM